MLAIQGKAPKVSLHQQALRRSSIAGMALIALFGGTVGLWAATATLSGAVVAGGQFVVDTSIKKVQHATGGIVGELKVRDGDRVQAGDLLVRLDETLTRANLQVVSKQLDEYLGRQVRLEAERDGAAEIKLPPEFAARLPSAPCSRRAAPPATPRRTSSGSASPSPGTRSRASRPSRRPRCARPR
jgi:HlyD family secretion protein